MEVPVTSLLQCLPQDMLVVMCLFLDTTSLGHLACTSKWLRDALRDEFLWRQLCEKVWGITHMIDGTQEWRETYKRLATTTVHVWGYGALGGGSWQEHRVPYRLRSLSSLRGGVRAVYCGGNHTALITYLGEFYTWGLGTHGQLGLGESTEEHYPRCVVGLQAVIHAALGSQHTAVVTRDGRLYTFGCGEFGRLGTGDDVDHRNPTLVEALQEEKVESVSCGHRHSAVVCEDGSLWTWGGGDVFQLGHGSDYDELLPRQVKLRELARQRVVQVACGRSHTVCLTDQGRVYAWGLPLNGQLGHAEHREEPLPRLVDSIEDVEQVAVGLNHTSCLLHDGSLFSFGNSTHFELWYPDVEGTMVPTRCEELVGTRLHRLACGPHRIVAAAEDGSVFAWGWGEYGQLGHGNRDDVLEPKRVDSLRGVYVHAVACGDEHTVALGHLVDNEDTT